MCHMFAKISLENQRRKETVEKNNYQYSSLFMYKLDRDESFFF